MKLFNRSLTIALAVILAVFLVGCTTTDNTKEVKSELTLGVLPSVDAVPFIVAKEKGIFDKYGLKVTIEVFKSAKDRDAAFQSGALDGALADEIAVSLYQNGGFDVKITGVTDGDFMLIAGKDSGIKSMNELSTKKIAISENTVIEYTLDKMLEANKLGIEAIEKVAIPAIPVRLEMLNNNQVDVALLPEPFSSFALNDGGILLANANSNGLFPAVSVFTQKAIDSKSKEIADFYKAYNEAVAYVNETAIADYEDIVIKTIGYPEEMKGKIKLPEYRKNVLPSDEELLSVIEWAVNNGLIKEGLKPADMVSDIGIK